MNQTAHPLAGLRPRSTHATRWIGALALGLAMLAACGGDGGTGTPDPVGSVRLTGAPEDVVLAGTTVQLTATPLSASGIPLVNRTVTWQSSDAAIATVSATGSVNVVGAGSVTITASVEGTQASATLDARAGGQLGPAGGTLRLLDDRITVTAPAGSFQFPTTLLFRPALSPPPDPRLVPGTAFDMEPHVLSVSPPPLLTLAYDPARLPAGVAEAGLQLYRVVDGSWRVVFGSVADTERNTVRGAVFGGGTYAVAAAAPATVAIDGALLGGAVYVGQARPLTAAPLDARGDTLRGRTITWSTSDPARATVDAAGNVTGQGAGTATITATVEGVQGSTTVTVLARPTPSWSGAGEWTTLQGNPRHDGHVAATLDPASFRERWAKPIGEFPRQAATGAGGVYVSTGILATKQLTAFDATTGAVRWSRTFPTAELISSPAYADGRVYVLVSGPDAALWSFDAVSGAVRFTQPSGDRYFAGPAVVVSGGVYLGGRSSSGGVVYRLDALTGEEAWQAPLPGGEAQTPAVADGRVLAFSMTALYDDSDVTVLDAADGSVDYTVSTSIQAVNGTPVLGGSGNVLASTGGQLTSIRLPGGDIAWSQPGSFGTYPAVGGGVVYASRANDVVAARESDGTVLWTWTPRRGVPWGPPLVTDNLLFISTQIVGPGGVPQYVTDAIDLASGKQVWSYPAGGFLALGADGTLFIAANGTLTSGGTYSNGTLTAIAVQ